MIRTPFRQPHARRRSGPDAPKRILVTGGAGFVGSHLCDRLLADGHHVICLDSFLTGRAANVAHLDGSERFELVEHDVQVPMAIPCDQIYNLACPASPPQYQSDPVSTMKTSVFGALNVLDLARANKARVLQASTSEVYGDPDFHPQPETYWGNVNPTGPRACYDEGKRCAETLFFDYRRQWGLDVKVARIFNTYGPRMNADDGRIVSNFVCQALRGEALTVYGDGRQTRSFCYVADLVEGLVRLMNSPAEISGPLNLGNPDEFTVLDLADQVIRLTRSPSRIAYHDLPEDDPKRRRPDIDRAKADLDWRPTVALEDGLALTVDHFRAELNGTRSDAPAPARPHPPVPAARSA